MSNAITKCNKGIILAGGTGSRLYPMTKLINKQLLPIYDKPAIYYPLTTLMLAGIKDILIICNTIDLKILKSFLKDGSQWNININYLVQAKPNGIAESFLIAKNFIANAPVCLILGDNLFYGVTFNKLLTKIANKIIGCHLFGYQVENPSKYGVAELDNNNNIIAIQEKPKSPKSNYAITGLYFYDHQVVDLAKTLTPSKRKELEITDINNIYIKNNQAHLKIIDKSTTWFDIGTPDALAKASQFVKLTQEQQLINIASPEEVAWRMRYISDDEFSNLIQNMPNGSNYMDKLKRVRENEYLGRNL